MSGVSKTVKPKSSIIWGDVKECVVDSHMHIMSGNCTPMPLLWEQGVPELVDRWMVIGAGKVIGRYRVDATEASKEIVESVRQTAVELTRVFNTVTDISIDLGTDLFSEWMFATAGLMTLYSNAYADFVTNVSDGAIGAASDAFGLLSDVYQSGASIDRQTSRLIESLAASIEKRPAVLKDTPVLGDCVAAIKEVNTGILRFISRSFNTLADAEAYLGSLAGTVALHVGTLGKEVTGALQRTKVASTIAIHLSALKLAEIVDKGGRYAQLKNDEGMAKLETMLTLTAQSVSTAINEGSIKASTAEISVKTAPQIAQQAVKENLGRWNAPGIAGIYPLVALGMDMEYSALCGYQARKIYREVSQRYYLVETNVGPSGVPVTSLFPCPPGYKPTGKADEFKVPGTAYYYMRRVSASDEGVPYWMHPREPKLFKKWPTQVAESIDAAAQCPWRIINMYHYEPRRWKNDPLFPFNRVLSKKDQAGNIDKRKLFFGFKMYPPLGFRPWDVKRLPHLKNFYEKCVNDDIPVISHCSPGGMYTFERQWYYDFDARNLDGKNGGAPDRKYLSIPDDKERAIRYFQEEYTSPAAWRKVLEENKKLKLCLAHFGGNDITPGRAQSGWNVFPSKWNSGQWPLWNEEIIRMITDDKPEYKSLYTDISYFFCLFGKDDEKTDFRKNFKQALKQAIKGNSRLANRIMFGTDWYMTLMESVAYDGYCRSAKILIDEITAELEQERVFPLGSIDLWTRFTLINPFEFFSFYELAEHYSNALLKNTAVKTKVMDRKKIIIAMHEKITELKQKGRT